MGAFRICTVSKAKCCTLASVYAVLKLSSLFAILYFFQAQTHAPCLSFDVIPDSLGDSRTEVRSQLAPIILCV